MKKNMKNNKTFKIGDIFFYCVKNSRDFEKGIAILIEQPNNQKFWPLRGKCLILNKIGLFQYNECIYLASTAE